MADGFSFGPVGPTEVALLVLTFLQTDGFQKTALTFQKEAAAILPAITHHPPVRNLVSILNEFHFLKSEQQRRFSFLSSMSAFEQKKIQDHAEKLWDLLDSYSSIQQAFPENTAKNKTDQRRHGYELSTPLPHKAIEPHQITSFDQGSRVQHDEHVGGKTYTNTHQAGFDPGPSKILTTNRGSKRIRSSNSEERAANVGQALNTKRSDTIKSQATNSLEITRPNENVIASVSTSISSSVKQQRNQPSFDNGINPSCAEGSDKSEGLLQNCQKDADASISLNFEPVLLPENLDVDSFLSKLNYE